jgi:murein DD-endopeptidase MepM/ murein hydrolase activator NlpD
MTQRKKSAHQQLHNSRQQDNTPKRFASTLPAQGLCWLGSISMLGGGFVFAQTEPSSIDNIVPTIENSQSTAASNPVKKEAAVSEPEKPQVEFSERRTRLERKLQQKKNSQAAAPVKTSQPKAESSEPAVTVRTSTPKAESSEPIVKIRTSKGKVENSEAAASTRNSQPQKDNTAVSPKPTVPTPEKLPEVAQSGNDSKVNINVGGEKTRDFNNAYIDPTDYSSGATGNYQAPSSVVITERASGCRAVLKLGQGANGACAKAPQTPRVAESGKKEAPSWLKKSETATLANVPSVKQSETKVSNTNERVVQPLANNANSRNWAMPSVGGTGHTKTAYRPNRFIPSPSEFATTTVSANPIAPSAGSLPAPMAEGNVAPRPSTVSYDFSLASVLPQVPYNPTVAYAAGGSGMVFPLSVPAPITSLFGWRIHPITGDRRFHAGADLGAPMGTPILAAAKGQVQTADWVGGYGLTVILSHSSAQQTLYGHMSEIFVSPGQWVEPGTVIGRVGSTGNSTGPHLHFEVRHLTQNGWVAVDPGVQLQAGLSQLVRGLRTAQIAQEPGR